MESTDNIYDQGLNGRPPTTDEERENDLISLAYDLVEKRLREGTATSQETVHFLRLGSSKERIERRMMEQEIELKQAKTEAMQSAKRIEELYANAIEAFRSYQGVQDDDE